MTNIAEAPPLEWLHGSGAKVSDILTAWDQGQLASIPTGRGWDVVRLPKPEGWRTVHQLRIVGAPTGPVLHAHKGVDVWVPAHYLDEDELPGARVLTPNELIEVPPPHIVAPHTLAGHSWIIPPTNEQPLTDAADLVGAYAAARASLQKDVAR